MDEEQVFEKVLSLLFGLYYTYNQPVAHVAYKSIPLIMICMKLFSIIRYVAHFEVLIYLKIKARSLKSLYRMHSR